MNDIQIKVEPIKVNISSYAMALMADDLHEASLNYPSKRFPFANFFLFCASIELGLKSAILSKECTKESKERVKALGHDLLQVYELYKSVFDTELLTAEEVEAVEKINKFYKKKGIEYFTLDVRVSMLKGYSDFPNIEIIKSISVKVVAFLRDNKHFINA